MIKPSLVEEGARWQVGDDLAKWMNGLSVGVAAEVSDALEQGASFAAGELFVPALVASAWPELVAAEMGLPGNCPLGLDLRLQGALGRAGCKLKARWLQPGKTIPAPGEEVRGCWITWSGKEYRLQAPLAEIIEQVKVFNQIDANDLDRQFRAWAVIRGCLGEEAADHLTDGFLKGLRVVTASAFTWRIQTDERGNVQLAPSLLTERRTEDGQDTEHVAALPVADEEIFVKRLDQLREGWKLAVVGSNGLTRITGFTHLWQRSLSRSRCSIRSMPMT